MRGPPVSGRRSVGAGGPPELAGAGSPEAAYLSSSRSSLHFYPLLSSPLGPWSDLRAWLECGHPDRGTTGHPQGAGEESSQGVCKPSYPLTCFKAHTPVVFNSQGFLSVCYVPGTVPAHFIFIATLILILQMRKLIG